MPPISAEIDLLQPSEVVSHMLHEGAALFAIGDALGAARRYTEATDAALDRGDRAGYGRGMAQLAALEESCGDVDRAFAHNRVAQETFLAIGDGAGLVQAFRVDAFLHLRADGHTSAASSFAKAFGLALQLDARMVLATLSQVIPAARHLIESDQVPALLPLGAAMQQAVESSEPDQLPDMSDFSELVATVGGVFAPLGVMAEEPALTAAQRRNLAARATHQAWLVDALTKRRWALAVLVQETLQTKLDFQEELD